MGIETAASDLLDSTAGNDLHALRAVLRVSQAVSGAQHLDDALEVIAEQSLIALDAASFSISRWERHRGVLRTLINVGQLGPREERWPRDEHYPLAEDRQVTELVRQGRPYVNSIDNDDENASGAVSLLRRLNKESELAVPVMCESAIWGELWATGGRGRRFGPDDLRLLAAIAAQVSVAIGRSEVFTEVSRCANEDPLTRLANRRGLDECLRRLENGGDGAPTLLVCDLDGLKQVNDRDGHPAGDALLRGVAGTLSDVASEFRASLVARLGGDEFCVVLPTASLARARKFACTASRRIAVEVGPDVSLCWGAAARDADTSTMQELITNADAALVEAKRLGPGRLRLHVPGERGMPAGPDRRRSLASRRRAADDLVPRFVELVEQRQPRTTLLALELLACELSDAARAAAWSISVTTDDFAGVRTVRGVQSALDPHSGLRVVELAKDKVYPLADYPATAQCLLHGSGFVAGIDLAGSDAAEVEVMRELGYRALLAVGTCDGQRGYLLKIYSDGDHAELAAIAPHARVLTHYCVQAVAGRPALPEAAYTLSGANADGTAQRE
jgi:diguanylate cyclase (GGDEF)-like protein